MTKDKTKKKRGDSSCGEAAAAAAAGFNGGGADFQPGWPRGWHPRPDSYYGAPYGSNSYDWHGWSSHMRGPDSNNNSTFGGEFGGFPRAAYPYPAGAMPNTTTAMPNSPTAVAARSSPSNESGKSQSDDGSSFSASHEQAGNKKRKRPVPTKKDKDNEPAKVKGKQQQQQQQVQQQQQQQIDESNAKNKRYGFDEIKDLVRFRTDLQSKFETMSTHLELWLSIGDKMCEKGHPKRAWESYRDKWDIELRRYQKELKNMLSQTSADMEQTDQLVFTDDVLQEIHRRLNTRPKTALRSRFQSGMGGARGCLDDATTTTNTTTSNNPVAAAAAATVTATREVAGKRVKKSTNNQQLVDTIVDKVVEKIGSFDDTATSQLLKEIYEAVVNLTNVLSAEVQQPHNFPEPLEIDDKVFTWLKGLGKEQYARNFAAAQVDWSNLMLLDRDDLVEMKIPLGPRKFILRELDKIRPEPLPPQPEQGEAGVLV